MPAACRCGDIDLAAAPAMKARAAVGPRHQGFYDGFARRCASLRQSRPGGWSPVTVLDEK